MDRVVDRYESCLEFFFSWLNKWNILELFRMSIWLLDGWKMKRNQVQIDFSPTAHRIPLQRHSYINTFKCEEWKISAPTVCYALSCTRAIFGVRVRLGLPDNIVTFVQNSGASWGSRCWFIALMMLRLWMQWQFIIFVIQFFAATFPIAMYDCAAAVATVRTVTTFWRVTFLFLMNYRWHIFDMLVHSLQ